MSNLNKALRLLRVFNDIKLSELAQKLNLSAGYLSEIESGKKDPTISVIRKYAELFNTKESAIMFFAENIEDDSKAKATIRKNIIKFLETIENMKIENVSSKNNK